MQDHFCRRILSVVFLAAIGATNPGAVAQTTSNAPQEKIGSIRVSGQKRFSAEQVIAASGLGAGEVFDPKELDDAAEKLGKSGAFAEVTYTYQAASGSVAVTFKVEEATKFRRCLFDNFVWLSDGEIQTRLKKEVGLYTGEAPETGEMLDDIAKTLEKMSLERGIAVHVAHSIQQDNIGDPNWNHLFRAEGTNVKIQSVSFAGTLTVDEKELQRVAAPLVGREYSSYECLVFGKSNFLSFYRERGYLQAKLAVPTAQILGRGNGGREFAVDVVYGVSEGRVYRWGGADWGGNQDLSTAKLESLLGMKPDEIANGNKIDQGWEAVKKEYGKSGYLEASVSPQPEFDEQAESVHYRVTVTEGAQYRMGSFTVLGVPAAVADRMKKLCKLKTGDVFDASYFGEFMKQDALALLRGALARTFKIRMATTRNAGLHTADVLLQVE